MKIGIIGNGIIAYSIAIKLLSKKNEITIIGKENEIGSASAAAGAMNNSYFEIEENFFSNNCDRDRFEISKRATKKWPNFLKKIDVNNKFLKNFKNCGTYLINNSSANSLEDQNYNLIINKLNEDKQEFYTFDPTKIPGYDPLDKQRAIKSIFLPGEKFLNASLILKKAYQKLKKNNVKFINFNCERIYDYINSSVILSNKKIVKFDKLIIAAGAESLNLIKNNFYKKGIVQQYYGSGITIDVYNDQVKIKDCIRTPNRGLACGTYIIPQGKNIYRLGSSNKISDKKIFHPDCYSVHGIIDGAICQINQKFKNSKIIKINVGWRPVTINSYPIIGFIKNTKILIVSGTRRDGWHMSPEISDYVAALITNKNYKYKNDYRHFVPYRKYLFKINKKNYLKMIVDHQFSALLQHGYSSGISYANEKIKNNIIDEAKSILKFHKFKNHLPLPEIYPYLKYLKSIGRRLI